MRTFKIALFFFKLILIIVVVALLFSCQHEDVRPTKDPNYKPRHERSREG